MGVSDLVLEGFVCLSPCRAKRQRPLGTLGSEMPAPTSRRPPVDRTPLSLGVWNGRWEPTFTRSWGPSMFDRFLDLPFFDLGEDVGVTLELPDLENRAGA